MGSHWFSSVQASPGSSPMTHYISSSHINTDPCAFVLENQDPEHKHIYPSQNETQICLALQAELLLT